jgi:2,3-dihydroxybenzoate-AMP ligase
MRKREGLVPYEPERARGYRDQGYWGTETIPTALGHVARANAERVALVTPDRRLTYGELDATTNRLAAGLLGLGLEPGDAVTLQLANTAETVEAWYALLKAGLIPVCTLPQHRHHEIDEIARLTGARAHIVQSDLPGFDVATFAQELAERVPTVQHLLSTRAAVEGLVTLDSLGADIDAESARQHVAGVQAATDADDVAVFQLSGGTTARPKVIPRLHAEYLYNVRARIERWAVTHDDVLGYVLPLVHNAGVQTSLHVAHLLGARLVLSAAEPDTFLPLFAREGVTRTLLPSGVAASLVDHPSFDETVAGLDYLALTLGKVPPSLFDRVTALGTTVIQEFGMGEGMIMTHALDDPEAARRDTIGSPISPADEVRLLDPDGNEVPFGEPGELNVRGPYTICGYLSEPERNAEVFSSDCFYATGDVMVAQIIEERVFYRLEDRTKDLINRGGEKVNTAEVEALLVEHPAIVTAAIVAMPDERLGERACAFITTDRDAPTLAEIRDHLATLEVAKFKWPERIEVVDELPRTAVGKVAKNVLRDNIRELLEREPKPAGG